MAELVSTPSVIEAAGTPAKVIREFIGRVNTGTGHVSIAWMTSPQGWSEPGQTPAFEEFTLVVRGALHVKLRDREMDVHEGQAVHLFPGEWVQYSTPSSEGAEYIAVCIPAFSQDTVHRDEEKPSYARAT